MASLITPDLVVLDTDLGQDRSRVIRFLAEQVVANGRATNADDLYADAWDRESKTDTGIPGGIAIPHCRSSAVTEATLVMARPRPGVDFGSTDGPADLIFFIAAPSGADQEHLRLLSKLARSLIRPDFTAALRAAATPQDVVDLVDGALGDEPAPAASAAPAARAAAAAQQQETTAGPGVTAASATQSRRVLVGVTACPTGIAHTYMAADSLVAAADRAGVTLYVETQGSSGSKPLDPAIIASAEAVIFAVDVDVRDKGRFGGKPLVQAPVKRGIDEPDKMIAEALAAASDPNANRVAAGAAGAAAAVGGGSGQKEHVGQFLKRVLLTGVSYMIPFVAGGGLLIALGFLIAGASPREGFELALTDDGNAVNNAVFALQNFNLANLPPEGLGWYLGSAFFQIGALSLGFLVPALAGYIAYAIADRPGIAPGFVVGAISGFLGAGFLGGIVGGLLAGYVALLIGRIPVARWVRGLMPVVIIPLVASIVASGLMLLVLGGPIAALTIGLSDFLNGLSGTGAVLLGVILGLMMCFDLGGPINKVAYAFAVAGLGAGSIDNPAPWQIMAAVMAAGMVPPLAMALASTVLARNLFTPVERENGNAAWLLGASFISEGAIPFAAADPLRVIPASMVGGAVTGAISMALGVTSQAPHGGIFVFFAISPIFGFILSIVVGTVISALIVVALKKFVRKAPADAPLEVPAGVPVTV